MKAKQYGKNTDITNTTARDINAKKTRQIGNSSNAYAMKSEGKKSNRNHLDEKQVYGPLSILTLTAQQRNNKLIKQKIMNCPSENKFTIIPRSVADDDIAHSNDINKIQNKQTRAEKV